MAVRLCTHHFWRGCHKFKLSGSICRRRLSLQIHWASILRPLSAHPLLPGFRGYFTSSLLARTDPPRRSPHHLPRRLRLPKGVRNESLPGFPHRLLQAGFPPRPSNYFCCLFSCCISRVPVVILNHRHIRTAYAGKTGSGISPRCRHYHFPALF